MIVKHNKCTESNKTYLLLSSVLETVNLFEGNISVPLDQKEWLSSSPKILKSIKVALMTSIDMCTAHEYLINFHRAYAVIYTEGDYPRADLLNQFERGCYIELFSGQLTLMGIILNVNVARGKTNVTLL